VVFAEADADTGPNPAAELGKRRAIRIRRTPKDFAKRNHVATASACTFAHVIRYPRLFLVTRRCVRPTETGTLIVRKEC